MLSFAFIKKNYLGCLFFLPYLRINRLAISISVVLGAVFLTTTSYAQTDTLQQFPEEHHFSLSDCIRYAEDHEHDIKNARLDQQFAEEQVRENTGKLLPHAEISGSFLDNLKLATTLIPDFQSGDLNHKIPVQFGNKYTSSLSGQINQTIFNSNYFIGLKAAKVYQELSVRSVDATRINTRVNVTKAYFNVLVNQEGIRIAKANQAQLEKSLQDTRAKYAAGIAETVDVNRIEVLVNNARVGIENQQRLLDYSLYELKFQMGMPLSDSLALSQTVQAFAVQTQSMDTSGYQVGDRPEYAIQQTQTELNALSLKSSRLSFLPSLSAYANYGYNYFAGSFGDLYDKGYGSSAIGLSLSFPIFSGTERIHRNHEARITLEQSQNDLDHLAENIRLEVKGAYVQYQNNLAQLGTQKTNMELTQGVYDRIKYKFDQGVSSSLDLLSAENELQQAQNNYIDALLNTLMSRVDLEKAMGRTLGAQP
jgi:outer membrane protein TolC